MNVMPDGRRIGSLREADWRLLLPEPRGGCFQHLVLLGAREGVAERLVRDGIARRVTTQAEELNASDPADAVVALGGGADAAPLDRLARLVARGGSLYVEVDRRAWGIAATPGRIHQALAAAGLTPIGTYWVRPNFEVRQAYVPVDAIGPLRWYLQCAFVPADLRGRLLGSTTAMLARWSRAAATAPIRRFAVTAVAGARADTVIESLARRAFPALSGSARIAVILNTNGGDERNRVVALPFAEGSDRPAGVLKSSRLPILNYLAEGEQRSLGKMRAALGPEMRDSLPRPLGVWRWGKIAVAAESYLDGTSMARLTRRSSAPLDAKIAAFRQAVEWLTEFNLRARVERLVWGDDVFDEYVRPHIRRYEEAYGLTRQERELVERLEERSRALAGTPMPLVWRHYAFAPWNIARAGEHIRVFDWEGALPDLPLFDLLYFAVRWYQDVRGTSGDRAQAEAFEQLLRPANRGASTTALVNAAIEEYLRRLGIDRQFRAVGIVSYAFERAVSRLERLPPAERVGRGREGEAGPYMIDVVVRHQESLFGARVPSGRVQIAEPDRVVA